MSATQAIAGAGVLGVALSAAIGVVLPAPEPIVIHELSVDARGIVTQDRTVTTRSDAFFATWTAAVIDVSSGEAVPNCEGTGAFPYQPGRLAPTMTLQKWTGNPACDFEALPPGEYQLRAAWYWGASQAAAESAPFIVPE